MSFKLDERLDLDFKRIQVSSLVSKEIRERINFLIKKLFPASFYMSMLIFGG